MPKSDFLQLDHLVIGLITGLLLPMIIMHFWLNLYLSLSLYDVIRNPYFSEIINILKGSIFVNLVLFFGFYWLRKDKSARGVIFATLLYGAFYVYYMFFM